LCRKPQDLKLSLPYPNGFIAGKGTNTTWQILRKVRNVLEVVLIILKKI